jgi:hypothetical protein
LESVLVYRDDTTYDDEENYHERSKDQAIDHGGRVNRVGLNLGNQARQKG